MGNKAREQRRKKDGSPMLKNTPALSKPFELRGRIVIHLATHPNTRIIDIMRGLNSEYHSAISRAMRELKEEGLVAEGPQSNRWILTKRGLFRIYDFYEDQLEKIRPIYTAYAKIYPQVAEQLRISNALEVAAGDRVNYVMERAMRLLSITAKLDLTESEWQAMVSAFIVGLLGDDGYLHYITLLDGRSYKDVKAEWVSDTRSKLAIIAQSY